MKLLKIVLMSAVFMLISATAQAQAAPECIGSAPVAAVDYSSGSGRMCLPGNLADAASTPIADDKVMTCTVEFFDGAGVSIGTVNVTGGPNSLHSFPVPRDGVGTGVAGCTLDAMVSVSSTTAVTFPVSSAPNAPVIMP